MLTNIFPKTLRQVRIVLWMAAGVAAVPGGLVLWRTATAPAEPVITVTGEAAITNAYTLTDHTGRPVTADSFAGRWQLIFFGFTYCPDICLTTLAYMANVVDLLGADAEPETGSTR